MLLIDTLLLNIGNKTQYITITWNNNSVEFLIKTDWQENGWGRCSVQNFGWGLHTSEIPHLLMR